MPTKKENKYREFSKTLSLVKLRLSVGEGEGVVGEEEEEEVKRIERWRR